MKLKCWIEAMRLRTLPVSVAGVITATALAIHDNVNITAVAILCLTFAVLAQIASNFANEYYDFKDGLDAPGRVGPRRGVTEGDITPGAMKLATFMTLGAACAVGLSLIHWGGWWLIAAGVLIAVGVLAYSSGPYPLSRHGLGEVAVIFFFGIIPVCLTYYVMSGTVTRTVALTSVAVGLMGANVLLVNNYRDADADRAVNKHTLAVIFGRRVASTLYLINGLVAVALLIPLLTDNAVAGSIIAAVYIILHARLWHMLTHRTGTALNPLLGMTSVLMLAVALSLLFIA